MDEFFVKTVESVVGPLSEVELREAVLANIIAHDAHIGHSSDGPWDSAVEFGFFNDKGVASPHPQDAVIPEFDVQGMPGAFQGPFKLRELIGFAARGMLPPDAQLRFDDQNTEAEWNSVSSVQILAETFSGRLVKVRSDGKLVLSTALDQGLVDDARAPIDIAPEVNHKDRTAYVARVTDVDPEFEAEQLRQSELAQQARQAADEKRAAEKVEKRKREEKKTKPRTPSANSTRKTLSRVANQAVVPLLLLLVGIVGFITWWNAESGPVPVSGQIYFNGSPLPGAALTFVPVSEGRPAVGTSDDSGRFSMRSDGHDGVLPGMYKVAVNVVQAVAVAESTDGLSPARAPEQASPAVQSASQSLPARYGSHTLSGLTIEVKREMPSLELELTDDQKASKRSPRS